MLIKISAMESLVIFFEIKEGCKVSCVKIFLADLFGSQYVFEILHTSLTVTNSENVVKFGSFLNWECKLFWKPRRVVRSLDTNLCVVNSCSGRYYTIFLSFQAWC